MADMEVTESAGSVNICISSSINNFHNGEVALKVVIPMIHENGMFTTNNNYYYEQSIKVKRH